MKEDNLIFKDHWEFDENVSEVFSDMIGRSIPDYKTMRDLCFRIGKTFVKPNTTILDLGCSNGIDIVKFVEKFDNRFVLIDNSLPMIKRAKEFINVSMGKLNVEIKKGDLIYYDLRDIENVSLCLCTFLLQFIPLEDRQRVISNIYKTMSKDACLIVTEKTIQESCENTELFCNSYYEIKKENGYTLEQIETKRKSLRTVMCPITIEETKRMLKAQGFRNVETFWQCLNFVGIVAIK